MVANIQRRQYEVMFDVVVTYQEAARTDPDIAEALQRVLDTRERVFREHITAIAGHLRAGVAIVDGVAVYVTLVLPEIYRTLVVEHGWSLDRYETWLGDQLAHQLLGPPTPDRPA